MGWWAIVCSRCNPSGSALYYRWYAAGLPSTRPMASGGGGWQHALGPRVGTMYSHPDPGAGPPQGGPLGVSLWVRTSPSSFAPAVRVPHAHLHGDAVFCRPLIAREVGACPLGREGAPESCTARNASCPSDRLGNGKYRMLSPIIHIIFVQD